MGKLLVILLIGLTFEAAGVVFLKKGISQIGEVKRISAAEIGRVIRTGATNGNVLAGVLFEALFFASLLILLSKSDVSFLWPLTALSFVMTTFASLLFLGEKVSGIRWAGVAFIVVGAALISYSEHIKDKAAPSRTSAAATPAS